MITKISRLINPMTRSRWSTRRMIREACHRLKRIQSSMINKRTENQKKGDRNRKTRVNKTRSRKTLCGSLGMRKTNNKMSSNMMLVVIPQKTRVILKGKMIKSLMATIMRMSKSKVMMNHKIIGDGDKIWKRRGSKLGYQFG